ncbi:MAG: iron complex outermembrane receptor protein [Saprospiraceae bacterium]|jgi:iron complex outermembrane receptor protein
MKKSTWPLVFGLVAFFIGDIFGQQDSIVKIGVIENIVVSATRLPSDVESSIYSSTVVDITSRQPYLQLRSLSEQLDMVPGVYMTNDNNYAQDQRISIRGFGARSAFGVRGIKLIVDGIPETTPDGQGQLDNLMLSDISSLQVLHGPSGSLYGNAAGGVISVKTTDPLLAKPLKASFRNGAYGLRNTAVSAGTHNRNSGIMLSMMHQNSDGYREHSASTQLNMAVKAAHKTDNSRLNFALHYTNSPKGEDPGGINLTDVTDDRQSARPNNVKFNSGESIKHWKSSLNYKLSFNPTLEFESYAFISGRSFEGRLPFGNGGWIDLNRFYYGLGSHLNIKQELGISLNKLLIGFDIAQQSDDRDRFVNVDGVQGAATLSQNESFGSVGLYLIDQLTSGKWTLRGALRYDINRLEVGDSFLSNGDDSGNRNINSFNPAIGINYNWSEDQFIYASYSTSFETPTLSELSSNPDGGGFNGNLNTQSARNLEFGVRGKLNERLSYDLTTYNIATDDEVLPYELEAFPGRTFFRNAGSTDRVGLESKISYIANDILTFDGSYSYSSIKFDEYIRDGDSFSGNRIPGLPQHQVGFSTVYENKDFIGRIHIDHASSLFGNDSNTVEVDERTRVNLSVSRKWKLEKMNFQLFASVNNLLPEEYYDNIRINAFGGRYYEAAPGRLWMVGGSFSLN